VAVRHRDFASAVAQYQKVVQFQPKSAAAHLDLGIALKGMGQVDKAFQEYDQVKKLDDSNAEVYYAIGVVFEKNKNLPEKALENYKLFIQKSGSPPNDHPVYQSIKNCEQLVALAQQADEEAKKQAEAAKEAELEKKNKAAADKAAPATAPAPNAGAKPGAPDQASPASATPAPAPRSGGDATPAAASKPAPEAAPAVATPPAAPAPKPDADEPPEGAGP
jgi:tetratricopeptide (TPR) repeat protein